MSKYVVLRTVLTDEAHLIGALRDLGYEPEVHPDAAALFGYMGDERPERANIIVRRNQLDSASNDIGFSRNSSGTYGAVLSEYDRGIGFNEAWLGKVSQAYKERQTLAVARSKGYVLRAREVIDTPQGKRIRLQFAVR